MNNELSQSFFSVDQPTSDVEMMEVVDEDGIIENVDVNDILSAD